MRPILASCLLFSLVLGMAGRPARGAESPAAGAAVGEARPSADASNSVEISPLERLRGVFGIVLILGLAWAISTNRRAISGRVLFWGLTLQWAFALLVLRVPAGAVVLRR